MSLSLTLDVVTSLVFVYVLVALLASTVNEMIAGVLKLRGVYLSKAIEALTSLGKDNSFTWGGVAGWMFAHLWQSGATVSRPVDRAAVEAAKAGEEAARRGASARDVAAAVKAAPGFEELAGLGAIIDAAVATGGGAGAILAIIRPMRGIAELQKHPMLVGTPSSLPSYVPARDFAAALLGVLENGSAALTFKQARATIEKLPDGDVKTTLLSFISAGATDIDSLRTRIEAWFDDAMERVGGIYKRFNQYLMLALGLLIAVGMNIDTLHMVRTLWTEPTVSNAIAAGATQYVNGNNLFACEGGGGTGGPDAAAKTCRKGSVQAIESVIDQEAFPIGRKTGDDFFGCSGGAAACGGPERAAWAVLGWLITAFAISLGAQFWFDLLSKATNLRAAGPRPERADKATS